MKTVRLFAFTLIILFSIFIKSNEVQKLIYASWDKPDVELFYKLPKEINPDTKVLFIIHGGSRDAEKYLSYWLDHAKDKNVILIAPHFTKENFPYYQTLGMATFSGRIINDKSNWLDNSIKNFFIFFKNKYSLKNDKYLMFGFSGGSQFIHRYLMYGNDKAIEKAAIGSAGWYTFISGEQFPYGIKNMPIEPGRIEWLLSQEILFLLGSKDNNPNDSSLNKSRGAKKQGKHRLDRGNAYFKNLITVGDRFNVPFRWRYKLIEGLDHSTKDMSQAAASFILSDLDYKE
tara:strand:+ start:1465 stop:2325 length:861 start_codon:yes stop_codon:yes gene_type:complete